MSQTLMAPRPMIVLVVLLVTTVLIAGEPPKTGGIIFRYFIGDGSCEDQIENIRRKIRVAPHA